MFLKKTTDNLLYKCVLFYENFPLRFKSQRRHRTFIGLIFTFIIIYPISKVNLAESRRACASLFAGTVSQNRFANTRGC